MASVKWQIGITLVTQLGVGILGNFSLLCLYNFTLLTGHKVRPTDVILNQLVLANSLVLFSRGIPHITAAFGATYFLNEAGCKFFFYFHRVARGVCLTTTSLLSVFQAVRLRLNVSSSMELRRRSSKCIYLCCCLRWILHLLVSIFVPIKMAGPTHSKNLSVRINYGYCSPLNQDGFLKFIVTALFSTIDLACLAFMVWASGSMATFLHRHRQQPFSQTFSRGQGHLYHFDPCELLSLFLLPVFSFVCLDDSICYSRTVAGGCLYIFVFMFLNIQSLCAHFQ
uniref:Vomeronasal type-1 receptor n=1 Tax=Acinonyx jubatus TaxID=32536 RepID=A0A0A0Y7N2_ACIJB|nr:vomeronasal receptor type I [Acinonyx jubatus]